MPHPPASDRSPRSYADDIRGRSDADLAALLLLRPDLARPAPGDLSGVAARAGTLASTARAIDALDRRMLSVLEAAVLLTWPVTTSGLVALLGDTLAEDDLEAALAELWRRGLLWRDEQGLRPVTSVLDTLGPYPAGLGPAASDLGAEILTPEELEAAPDDVHTVLQALAWGPPVAEAPPSSSRTGQAIGWLKTRNALGHNEAGEVIVPRELGLTLRGGRSHRTHDLELPEPTNATTPRRELVNTAAGGAAAELLAQSDELLACLATDPVPVLKNGGFGVRELRSLARDLDLDVARTAYLLELLVGGGLVADDGELEPHFVPTADYDAWRQNPPSQQWSALAWGWWTSTRSLHLLPESGAGVLGGDLSWPPVRALRQDIIGVLDGLGGRAVDAAAVEAAVRFARPRRVPPDLSAVIGQALSEAGRLGVVALDTLSDTGRDLLRANGADDLPEAIEPHLPARVEHVILQGDLTAIAPGPLTGQLADVMRLAAEVESRGGATVYRFSAASVRRAFDRGWTADELLEAVTSGSLTAVPQALDYLIRDEARRHGQVRVGPARTYVRSDDPARLAELLTRRDLSLLQLSQVAPSVLVSPVDPSVAHDVLREAGVGAITETPTGERVHRQLRERRTTRRARPRVTHSLLTPEVATELVATLRAGEEAAANRPATGRSPLPQTDPATALAILREAAADQTPVWVGYAGGSGQVERILFHPESTEGGRVTGTANGVRRTLSIHRITGAAPA